MKSISTFFLVLLFGLNSFAQQRNDSLDPSLNNSAQRLIFLDWIIESKIYLAPKEAVRFAYEASTIVQTMPESELVAKTYKVIGDNYQILGIMIAPLRSMPRD